MRTLKLDRFKRAVTVLLIVCFVISITASTVSAKNNSVDKNQLKNNIVSSFVVNNNIKSSIAVVINPVITVVNVFSIGNSGDTITNVGANVGVVTTQ